MMRIHPATLLAAFASCSLTSCGVNISRVSIIVHDQQAAAKSAAKFADLAFVRSDYASAQALLAPQVRQGIPIDRLTAEVAKMHPKARPSEVAAMEFEPMPGQPAMNIYLKGTHGDETFFYRLVMVGDKGSGYQVAGFWRGSGPYPPSARRPL
jgi:hypothetical protein